MISFEFLLHHYNYMDLDIIAFAMISVFLSAM